MKTFSVKFINLLLYSNFWIAAAGLAMTLQTYFVYENAIILNSLSYFVFSSTLFLYALHRIVGLVKVQSFTNKGRFKVISTFKRHIVIYAILAGIANLYFFFLLTWKVKFLLFIPGIISLAYVIPVLKKKKRLRDLSFIKIFLIAIVWAWVTVALPIYEMEGSMDLNAILMILERMLFIFAITLPFDIRDLRVDETNNVMTIPAKIGIPKTKLLAHLCMALMCISIFINYFLAFYSLPIFIALLISVISTSIIIHFSNDKRHDYFYTGLLDGTMIIQFLLIYFATKI